MKKNYQGVCPIFFLGAFLGACTTMLSAGSVQAQEPAPLVLAEKSKTEYVIVIGKNASAAIRYAAEEMRYFLNKMTGATYDIVSDAMAARDKEIVIGKTVRFSMEQIPKDLRPAVLEGFVIYRDGSKLVFLGNSDRAVLYGVYDFLEQELGCRFLAANFNHVPSKPSLSLDFKSRRYDPPLEKRNVVNPHEGEKWHENEKWTVRARLNGNWSCVPMEKKLGGAKYIGAANHSFGLLVPSDVYFKEHPEYYALVDGVRIKTVDTLHGQLCLTNPDVLSISIKTIKKWIDEYKKSPNYNSESLTFVSVAPNDNQNHCECPQCEEINEEEGSRGGTLYRFVNSIAEAVKVNYPNDDIRVSTLAYGETIVPPKKTVLKENVVVVIAPLAVDFARMLNDPSSEFNVPDFKSMSAWSKMLPEGFYVWSYYLADHPNIKPYPNFPVIDKNIRLFREMGMKGMFAEATYAEATELRALRNYLLAQCMWRPETTDGRKVIEEFCRLYYGQGAPYILEYIDFVDKTFREQNIPLRLSAEPQMQYTDGFLSQADSILERAENAAENDIFKQHVANTRLAVWYLMIRRAFQTEGVVMTLPLEWYFKIDPNDVGIKENWAEQCPKDWDKIKVNDSWTEQGYDYHGVAWYAVEFEVPESQSTMDKLSFHFGAVDGYCDVFLNGKLIGSQTVEPEKMWNQPFSIPVSNLIAPGKNRLVVRVRKEFHAAGIWKPVALIDESNAVSDRMRTICRRFMENARRIGAKRSGAGIWGRDDLVLDFFPQIEALLRRQLQPDRKQGTKSIQAVFLPNDHRTYSEVTDQNGV